jgi:uracil-DNA glycosylase
MLTNLPLDWAERLQSETEQIYYRDLSARLAEAYRSSTVYPPPEQLFQAMAYTSYADTKVVILGQDPYHGPSQAHGLSFSVPSGVPIPPSLRNIYKELHDDVGCPIPRHGCLVHWARQGVLLLNAVLSVEADRAGSHSRIGWERLTDRIVHVLNERERPVVFLLWGKHAQDKASFIDRSRHGVIESVHPSPLAAYRGFFGSRPFSRANAFLRSHGIAEIDWHIPDEPEV